MCRNSDQELLIRMCLDVFQVEAGLADACLGFENMQARFLRTDGFQKLVSQIKFCFFDRNILLLLYRQNRAVSRLSGQNHVFGMEAVFLIRAGMTAGGLIIHFYEHMQNLSPVSLVIGFMACILFRLQNTQKLCFSFFNIDQVGCNV